MICPLCQHVATPFLKKEFYHCPHCAGIFRDRNNLISSQEERRRYEQHNNDVEDPGYQQFVSPITSYVLSTFSPRSAGLDFGAGPGPVICKVLKDKGYNILPYDPFFANYKTLLDRKYDYIVCCEVMEHFHHPRHEWSRLYHMLEPEGMVVGMTHLYSGEIDFASWYYKNDPTHVFIYQAATIEYIANTFSFRSFEVNNRLIVLKK